MGESCNIYLSADVRINDVINVIGILLGQKKNKNYIEKFWACDVEDVKEYGATNITSENASKENIHLRNYDTVPTMLEVVIRKNKIDKQPHTAYYHFETNNGMRLLCGGNSDFWHKVGKGLVEFFGGWVDYNDCDSIEKDFEAEKPRGSNHGESDEEFDAFQNDLWNLKPIV